MNARAALILGGLATSFASSAAFAQPSQVRVVWTTSPDRHAVISWSTARDVPTHMVWDTDSHASVTEYAHTAKTKVSGQYTDGEPQLFHHAELSALQPSQVVHFRVVADGAESTDYWFRTAPDDATPFTLLYGGDSRSDPRARRRMNRRIATLAADDASVLALAHGGDYIGRGSSWAQWNRWLNDWQQSIGEDGHVLPIIPTRGNHEGDGVLFNTVFGFPGDPEASGDWFATQIGQDFVLLTLDSNVSQGGSQRKWLDQALQNAQSSRWITAGYHRPAYPAVKSPGGALQHWVPLFEQYNVDFVFESDGHVLKRTVPIRADQPDPTGIVYVGEGGLGVPQRTPKDRWYLRPPGMARSAHHVQVVRVSPGAIIYTAVDMEGEVIDRYEFTPKRVGKGTPAPSVSPLPVGKTPPAPPPSATTGCSSTGGSSAPSLLPLGLLLGLLGFFGLRPEQKQRQR